MTTSEDLATLRGVLDGKIHWGGVGPQPWWGPLQRVEEQLASLITLVRLGYLVTVNGERGRTDVVNDPALRDLLFTILQAKDTATAIAAVASSPEHENLSTAYRNLNADYGNVLTLSVALQTRVVELENEIARVLHKGKLGKQTRRRLKALLKGLEEK